MRKMLLAALLLSAAACSQPVQTTASRSSTIASTASPAPSDQPTVRAGLWESVSTRPGHAAETDQSCATGSLADYLGTSDNCQAPRITRTADGWTFEAHCSADGDLEQFHADIHGDLQSHFTVDIAPATGGDTALHSENRFVGACHAQ